MIIDYEYFDHSLLTTEQIKLLLERCDINDSSDEKNILYGWYKIDPEVREKIDNWRESLAPKDPTKYKTKRSENVNMKEVNKHDSKLKAKEEWFNKFVKKWLTIYDNKVIFI